MTRRPTTGIWTAIAVAGVAWALVGWLVVPSLVASGYAGESLGVVNDVFAGRDSHDLQFYLDKWSRLRLKLTFLGLGLVVLAALLNRMRGALGAKLEPLLARAEPIGGAAIVGLAAVVGCIAGLIELLVVIVRMAVSAYPGYWYPTGSAWMTPLALTLALTTVGVLLAILNRLAPRLFGMQTVLMLVLSIAVFGLLSSAITGVHAAAMWVFGIGIASRLVPLLMKRRDGVRRVHRRGAPLVVAVLLLFAIGQTAVRSGVEAARGGDLPSARDGAPNVLLIVLDTVRAASLSLHGYGRPTTPGLDALAERSVVFEHAMAPAPWTLPSHATLFSGRVHRDISWASPVPWGSPTLAETLSANGYRTGGFIANLSFCQRYFGLNRGFTHYEDYPVSMGMVVLSSWLTRTTYRKWFEDPEHPVVKKTAEQVNTAFLEWVGDAQSDAAPFYAFLNYMDAHDPYVPPEPWGTRFREIRGRVRLGPVGHPYTDDEVQQLRDAYDGAIAYLDDQITRLLAELDRRGLLEDTLLIVTSDHGEEFYENGIMGHSHSLHWPSIHVPLLLHHPGTVPEGLRVDSAVGLRHVPATVAELLEIDRSDADGPSLVDVWEAAASGTPLPSTPLFAEAIEKPYPQPDHYPIAGGGLRSVLLDGLHYIRAADGSEKVFDIRIDPFEQNDLLDDPDMQPRIEALRRAFETADEATLSGR